MTLQKVLIYTDGGADPNPGQAGIGAVITDEAGKQLAIVCESIGFATNNQAEYQALIAALKKAKQLGAAEAVVYADSELLVRQINGVYRVKNEGIKPLFEQVKRLAAGFGKFSITHVPREMNSLADGLASKAIRMARAKIKNS